MVADNDLIVVLGPRRHSGQEHGATHRVRYQVQLGVSGAVQHEIDHGRHVVVGPFVDAVKETQKKGCGICHGAPEIEDKAAVKVYSQWHSWGGEGARDNLALKVI